MCTTCKRQLLFAPLQFIITFVYTSAIDNFFIPTAIVNFQMHFYNCQHFMEYGKWNLLYEQLHLRTFVCIIVFQCFYVPSNRYLLYAQMNLIPFCLFEIDNFLSQPNNNHNPNNKTTITVVGLRQSNWMGTPPPPPRVSHNFPI